MTCHKTNQFSFSFLVHSLLRVHNWILSFIPCGTIIAFYTTFHWFIWIFHVVFIALIPVHNIYIIFYGDFKGFKVTFFFHTVIILVGKCGSGSNKKLRKKIVLVVCLSHYKVKKKNLTYTNKFSSVGCAKNRSYQCHLSETHCVENENMYRFFPEY